MSTQNQPKTTKPARPATARSPPTAQSTKGSSSTARPSTAISLASQKEAEKLLGRTFKPNEASQFELVKVLKPDWNSQQVTDFCKKHGFDEKTISHQLSVEFEYDRSAHDAVIEEWVEVPKKELKKKDEKPAPAGKFAPAANGKPTNGKPAPTADAKASAKGGKYVPSAASDRAYAAMKAKEKAKEDEERKKKEVVLPVPGKSFLAALVKPQAPAPAAAPAAAPAKADAKSDAKPATNGDAKPADAKAAGSDHKEDGANKGNNPQLARLSAHAKPKTDAAAPAAEVKTDAKAAPAIAAPAAKDAAATPSSPSSTAPAQGGKAWKKKEEKQAKAEAAAAATTSTPAASTTPASTPAAATSTPAATPVSSSAAPSTSAPSTAASHASDAAPVTSPPTSRSNSNAPSSAAKSHPAPAVNKTVSELFNSDQKVLLPSAIAAASTAGTFQFGAADGKPAGPRAPKPKEAAQPVAAAPAAAAQPVQQPVGFAANNAAAAPIGASRNFLSGAAAAPIGSKPIQSHLDNSLAPAANAAADSEIIAGGHAAAHPFGNAIHDDSLTATNTDASSYDNSQYNSFHNDVLAGGNAASQSVGNFDNDYSQNQSDEFYGYNQFDYRNKNQRPPQGQPRPQGQQNFNQPRAANAAGLPKAGAPGQTIQQPQAVGPNAANRAVNAVQNAPKPAAPQQPQAAPQQANRPVGAPTNAGFPQQQQPANFQNKPQQQQPPQPAQAPYNPQGFPQNMQLKQFGQPNQPNQFQKNLAPGQQNYKQFSKPNTQNNPQAYNTYGYYNNSYPNYSVAPGYGYGALPSYQGYPYSPYQQAPAAFAPPARGFSPQYNQNGFYPQTTFDNSYGAATDDYSKQQHMYPQAPAVPASAVGTDGQPLLPQTNAQPAVGSYDATWSQDAIGGNKGAVKSDAPADLNRGIPSYTAGFGSAPLAAGPPAQNYQAFQPHQQSHLIHPQYTQPEQQRYQQYGNNWSSQ